MSNESIEMIKTKTEQLRIKKKQLLALQTKEVEGNEKAAMLEKSLAQANKDHEACLLSNLAGNTTDKALDQSKSTIKKLIDSIQEANEISEPMQRIKHDLQFEIYDLEGNIAAHRSILCRELEKEAREEIAANKKLTEQLSEGFVAFMSNGEPNNTWERFLLLNFPHPSQHDIHNAVDKFKAAYEFMRE